jgi:hypothetical protein
MCKITDGHEVHKLQKSFIYILRFVCLCWILTMFLTKTFLYALFLLTTSNTFFVAATNNIAAGNASVALQVLQRNYNTSNGLWNTTGWWNSANCLTVLGGMASFDTTTKTTAVAVMSNTFNQAQIFNLQLTKVVTENYLYRSLYGPIFPEAIVVPESVNPKGFLNTFYDDEGWWALAWIQAFDVTGDPRYLTTAVDIFEDMKDGGITPCSTVEGGIWWDKAHTYVNAIANELYLSVGAHLANRVASQNQTYFLNIARNQWNWFQASGLINDGNTINDGLRLATCKNNNETVWSYSKFI